MKHIPLIVILVFSGCNSTPEHEANLMMKRPDREPTYRASFRFKQDCELVAKEINKTETLVNWYCE